MIRVAHVSPSFHPAFSYGGPTESSYQLSRHLAREGCDVRVLTTNANGARVLDVDTTRELELEPRLRVRYCPRRFADSASPELLRRLAPLARWADLLHLNYIYTFPSIPTLATAALLDKPLVWTARGALQRWEHVRSGRKKAVWEALCKVVKPRRLAIHYTSNEERDESEARFPTARSLVVPNGVVIPASPPEHVPSETFRITALGRLHPIKGLEHLVAAAAELRGRAFGPFSVTLAGAGDAEYTRLLERAIRELSLEHVVALPGEIRGEAKRRLFAETDLLVAPSYRENFGNSIAEAMAHGVPVVAGQGTPWRRLEERGAGLWVPNDARSLADAIERVRSMPLGEMGARGRAWVEEEFGWGHVARTMIAAYRDLLR